ncbi:MAG: family 1 encapsulin nanocompartment shell protein [Curtobacterium sp.]
MIDDEARVRLRPVLTARTLVDFAGPFGWEYSATNAGRVGPQVASPVPGTVGRQRVVIPLAELRASFTLSRSELEAASRGAGDVDLSALDRAAHALARAENTTAFDGWSQVRFDGVDAAAPETVDELTGPGPLLPQLAASAVARLQDAGVSGPYARAADERTWIAIEGGVEAGGGTLARHLERVLGGPIVRVPGIRSSTVVSLRGGDFVFESGQDVSVGYEGHTDDSVGLYLEESFTFRVDTPGSSRGADPGHRRPLRAAPSHHS